MMKWILLGLLVVVVLVLLANIKKIGPAIEKLKVFFDEVSFEMTKVAWPSQDEVVSGTILVGVVCVIVTLMVGVADKFLSELVKLMF
jgi:preprotein translocase SecE subunit